jgi:DNA replicative helicase MCM subunit Mcm2 (Cdc46/Mcm family)
MGNYENYKEIADIEYLLNERIIVMNDFLYGSKNVNDISNLKNDLSRIEAEKLLENDLDILKKVIDNPTDYELAMNVKVDKIISLEKLEDGYNINADLKWLMSGYDGEFNLVKNYDIKCVNLSDKTYLAELKYID